MPVLGSYGTTIFQLQALLRFLFESGMERVLQIRKSMASAPDRQDKIAGVLLGTAVGDSLGLPFEGLSLRRNRRRLKKGLRHGLLFRRGMMSDDTEHACLAGDEIRLREAVRASTRITHTDPKAEEGALAVALAAAYAITRDPRHIRPGELLDILEGHATGEQFCEFLSLVRDHLRRDSDPAELADSMGLKRGVTGYVNHTVPTALFCWLRRPTDFQHAIESIVRMGGDTDTTAAITGALAGATLGAGSIPHEWTAGILEWPRSTKWIRKLSIHLEQSLIGPGNGKRSRPLPLFWPAILPRNLFFMLVVLAHGFRRLLPPY